MAVAVGRTGTDGGAEPGVGDSSSPFLTGHADIIGWLDVLLKGKSDDQARARTEIAMILEERGFADDAEEAYWTNVQSGSADRRAYERLIALYRERQDRLSASLVQRKLDEVFSTGATPLGTVNRQPHTSAASGAATPTPTPASQSPAARPVRRLRSAARRPNGATTPERPDNPRLGAKPAPAATPRSSVAPAPARALSAATPPTRTPVTSRAYAGAQRALPAAGTQPIQAHEVAPADLADAPRRARYATLLPNPGRGGFQFNTGGLIVLQPATIAAFLLASVGAAAVISFLIIVFDRGGVVPVASAASQATNRCADGSTRFPGANDPRGAVVAAYKQQGIDVDAPRPGGPRVTADQAELVVGGWMAASLMLEHTGQPAPTLVAWLNPAPDQSTLANAILSGRGLDSMLTHDEWSDMRAWPASSCEGAFVRDSRNAGLMKLVERVVTK